MKRLINVVNEDDKNWNQELSLRVDDYLTDSIVHSLRWESNICPDNQKVPPILWKPKVHYRVHNSPLLVSVPSQMDPVNIVPFSFFTTNEEATAERNRWQLRSPGDGKQEPTLFIFTAQHKWREEGGERGGRNIYRCHIINQYEHAVIKPMLLSERWMEM
jgi:hypothetical protein